MFLDVPINPRRRRRRLSSMQKKGDLSSLAVFRRKSFGRRLPVERRSREAPTNIVRRPLKLKKDGVSLSPSRQGE